MKFKVTLDIEDVIYQLWRDSSEDELLDLIKSIDERVSTVEFTRKIYEYAKWELGRMEESI